MIKNEYVNIRNLTNCYFSFINITYICIITILQIMVIRAFIAEDETKTLNSIKNIIENYCSDIVLSGTSQNVKEAIEFLSKNDTDLFLTDINFPDGTAFDIFNKLNSFNFKVVFITAYEKYAVRAIKISAVDFLLKPVNPKELISAVNKARIEIENKYSDLVRIKTLLSNMNNETKSFKKIIVKTSERINVIDITDIVRCESDTSYTSFFLKNNKKIISSKNLKEYDEMLSASGFLRTHKSHLVNLDYIKSFEKAGGGFLILKDQSKIPVSIRKKEFVLDALNNLH